VLRNAGALPVADGTGLWPTDALLIHPDSFTDVIVRWTAPADGAYHYSGLFEVLDEYPTGVITNIFVNNKNVHDRALGRAPADLLTLTPGSTDHFSSTVDLKAGDSLFFVVNSEGGNRNFDSTGLAVTITDQPVGPGIPEPTSWALMLLGVAGIGSALRSKRATAAERRAQAAGLQGRG
jgi:hypothetical protein